MAATAIKAFENNEPPASKIDPDHLIAVLGIRTASADTFVRTLPFCGADTTAGCENEFQAVVCGKRENVDLARTIEASNYYRNLLKQSRSGDTPEKKVLALEGFLKEKDGKAWENSWVYFPRNTLNHPAHAVFNKDLLADKSNPSAGKRNDAHLFAGGENNQVRVPISYLLKLGLADALGEKKELPLNVRICGEKMLTHFSNDNSSPELFSFYLVRSKYRSGLGREIGAETLIRFLMVQALVAYTQDKFLLSRTGQKVQVYFSPTPPTGQKKLNDCISDAFYRELFMSPCLSGWERGEEKKEYMSLCHKVLSRSQINGVSRIKEAGIIHTNLVVLPNISNTSLANNGTHISLGSRKLSGLLSDKRSGFTVEHEKFTGDLSIKICEHFLPLMVNTYSAAPQRFEFEMFHPERVLGFLPHELIDTHLRMIWRRWRKKAHIRFMGKSVTPFGPVWLDRMLAKVLHLKGDFIPDARLIDYFTSVLSTFQSPALDGNLAGEARLRQDLDEMGVFDRRMPLYQLIRLRRSEIMGYSGFEHRYFSVFEDVIRDMGKAADLQLLITALSQKYIYSKQVEHGMIPDDPGIESERRQIFFAAAIGIPTFFVKTRTRNQFLLKILKFAQKTRASRRYPGFTRVLVSEYLKALIQVIRTDGRDIIESFRMEKVIKDLEKRISHPHTHSAWGRLTAGIMGDKKVSPLSVSGRIFNQDAEYYYRETLRKNHIDQACEVLFKSFEKLDLWARFRDTAYGNAIDAILGDQDLFVFLKSIHQAFADDNPCREDMKKLIYLIILVVNFELQAGADKNEK